MMKAVAARDRAWERGDMGPMMPSPEPPPAEADARRAEERLRLEGLPRDPVTSTGAARLLHELRVHQLEMLPEQDDSMATIPPPRCGAG